jgi:ubiquitin C-terminal hydrolase
MRLKDEPSGLRNIGNSSNFIDLACYFNVFVQLLYHINGVRDMFLQGSFKADKASLPASVQTLFAQMLFSKFAYCDPTEVFTTLNRSNPDKIQLGDEYDFNEYFSITLDTIEKCLKQEPTMESK